MSENEMEYRGSKSIISILKYIGLTVLKKMFVVVKEQRLDGG
jgi:hypothetical protein